MALQDLAPIGAPKLKQFSVFSAEWNKSDNGRQLGQIKDMPCLCVCGLEFLAFPTWHRIRGDADEPFKSHDNKLDNVKCPIIIRIRPKNEPIYLARGSTKIFATVATSRVQPKSHFYLLMRHQTQYTTVDIWRSKEPKFVYYIEMLTHTWAKEQYLTE